MNEHELLESIQRCLKSSTASIRCSELLEILTKLGFEVRDGKKQGHKIVLHHGIESFRSTSYTCGHGKNPEIKPIYIKNIIKLLNQYEYELIQYLGERDEY